MNPRILETVILIESTKINTHEYYRNETTVPSHWCF